MLNEDLKPSGCIGRFKTRMLMAFWVNVGMNEMCCAEWGARRVSVLHGMHYFFTERIVRH